MRVSLWVVVALTTPGFMFASALAQPQRAVAALVLSEGMVYVNDRSIDANATPFVLPDVALLHTTQGRAAVGLKRGAALFLDTESSVRVRGNGLYNFNRLEVLSGSAIVASGTSAPLVDCESQISLSSAGLFRFDAKPVDAAGERPCRIRVYEGAAAIPLVTVTNALRAGQSMTCNRRCGDMIPTIEFSPTQLDGFDEWVRRVQRQFKN